MGETKKRGSWGNWTEYLFTFLGSMVGFGNVWRFPYICYKSGGGAFLVPFFLAIVVLGIPITFLETSYSQYSSYGPGRVWEICPLFKGIGLSMVIMLFVTSVNYTMLMAWTLYYLGNSFKDPIPWTHCDNEWNTENCTVSINESLRNTTTSLNKGAEESNWKVSPTEEFWFNKALDISDGIHDLGSFRWELVLCLLGAWIVVFLCVVKSIKSIGKIAYVAASLPYVILTILLIRVCMLPGASDGFYFFLVPKWELLGSFTVWRDAASQMFYSISVGSGSAGTLASYNKFHNNCYKDAFLLPLLDSLTSLFAGVVTFAYLGYMAHLTNSQVDDVVAQGPGLVFFAYPTALSTLPLPQLWSVLFFFMMFTMGLDTQFVHMETFSTAIVDCFPKLLRRKVLVTLLLCIVSFFLGLPLTTQGGVYVLNILDYYGAAITLLMMSALEVTVLAWIYGTDRLFSDIQLMIGYKPNIVFKYAWKYITPVIIAFLWIVGFVFFESISTKQPGFNESSDIAGVSLAIAPAIAVPVLAARELMKRKGSLTERIRDALRPTSKWRPAIDDKDDQGEEPMGLNGVVSGFMYDDDLV